MLKERPDQKETQGNDEQKALDIKAHFNMLKERLGKEYGYRAVMKAVADFGEKIKERFGDLRQNFRLYHVLAGSTINPNRAHEVTEFDFPEDSKLSVEEFINNGFEEAVKEESKKIKEKNDF